jgi:hypothetical protein
LNKFYKVDNPAYKRAKALMPFLQEATDTEQQHFFSIHHVATYRVVLDSMHNFDFRFSNNEAVLSDDVFGTLFILEKLVFYTKDRIRQRWQARSIANLITDLLYYGNDSEMRIKAVNLLLQFMDIMRQSCDQAVIKVFACSVNFEPFCERDALSLHAFFSSRQLAAQNEAFLFARPKVLPHVEQRKAENESILQQLLRFASADADKDEYRFMFWFDLLKTKIFPNLYPAVCQSIGIVDEPGSEKATGFRPDCPPALQVCVITWLIDCLNLPELASLIFNSDDNMKIVMEIFRQTFLLDLDNANPIMSVINMYRRWIQGVCFIVLEFVNSMCAF